MSAALTAAAAVSVVAGLGGGVWLSARWGAAQRRMLLARLERAQQETAQARLELAKAEYAATHDGLTGIANRTKLYGFGEVAVREATGPLAVIMCDLDKFKPINDTFGHHVGDAVLRQVAVRLETALGAHGMVARLGGDEFAAVINLAQGRSVSDSWLRTFDRFVDVAEAVSAPMVAAGRTHKVGISIGAVIVTPGPQRVFAEVLRAADGLLYEAKTSSPSAVIFPFDKPSLCAFDELPIIERPVTRLRDVPVDQAVAA